MSYPLLQITKKRIQGQLWNRFMENTMLFPIKKHILNESSISEIEKGEDKNQPNITMFLSLSEMILALLLGSNKWADTLQSKPYQDFSARVTSSLTINGPN